VPGTLFAVTVVVAAVAGLFMAWSIGAVAIGGGAFAPAVGANAIPVRRAAFLLAVVGFFGALLQGASVTETIGTGLVRGTAVTPLAAGVAILLSAVLMAIGAVRRYPIPAAFTVTGSMVAAGLALGGAPAWDTYGRLAAVWVVAPFLVAFASYGIAKLLVRDDLPQEYAVSVVAGVVFLTLPLFEFPYLGAGGGRDSVAGAVASSTAIAAEASLVALPAIFALGGGWLGFRLANHHGESETNRRLLVWLGILVAFSGAGNQIGLAVGPVLPLLETLPVGYSPVLFVAALGLVVGALTGSPRLIEAVAREYATLSLSRSIAALVPAFLLAQIAIAYGVPVSFNEIIIAAIVGSGAATGDADEVNPRKLYLTIAAWVGSLVGAFAVTYAIVRLFVGWGVA
jgi:PiT family inorganic phosphate transporter